MAAVLSFAIENRTTAANCALKLVPNLSASALTVTLWPSMSIVGNVVAASLDTLLAERPVIFASEWIV